MEFWTAKALLDWQVEMGCDEAIGDEPVDRYALKDVKTAPKPVQAPSTPASAPPPVAPPAPEVDQISAARDAANAAQDLAGLRVAMAAFE
ncbi:MAG: uracil-DNA glycosylase, partial [Octadecabacter sp.]